MYDPPHPPPPGPTPEEARAALALTEATPIPVPLRDLVLWAVGAAGAQVTIGSALLLVPRVVADFVVARMVGVAILRFLFLQSFAKTVPRGSKTQTAFAWLFTAWFAIWLHAQDRSNIAHAGDRYGVRGRAGRARARWWLRLSANGRLACAQHLAAPRAIAGD